MKIKRVLLLLIVFLLFCQIADIYGDTLMREKLRSMWQDTWIKAGPFRIKAVLFLNDVGFDSNVYRTNTNPINDFTITAGPGLTVFLPVKKRILFSIYGSPQYVFFKDTERERSWNTYLNGGVHFFINRFLFSFVKGYSDARERWNTEIDIRPRRKEDRFQGSVLWQPSKRTSFSLGYRKVKYDYESTDYETYNFRERLNREEDYLSISGFYERSYRFKYFVRVEYGVFNFENPQTFNNSESLGVYGGIEYSPFGRIRGKIHLGYKFFDSKDPERQDFRGIVGDTNVSIRVAKPLTIRALYERDVRFSLYQDSTYFLENRYGGGVSVYFLKRVRVDYDYSRGRNTYPRKELIGKNSQLIAGSSQESAELEGDSSWEERKDGYVIHSVGLYFRIKGNIGIGLIYSHWVRESNVWFGEIGQDFVGLNLTYDF